MRADFEGGALSSDFGALLLRETALHNGLIARLCSAIDDRRHPSYVNHSLRDLLTQHIFQVACGYPDANDSNTLRHDPMFKLGAQRRPLAACRTFTSKEANAAGKMGADDELAPARPG